MKITFTKGAEEDLQGLNRKELRNIKQKIDELASNPTGHEDSKLIKIKDRDIYRLEIKEERNGEIDHRAIYDIEDNQIRIYSIIYRDSGYQEEKIAERF